MQDMLCKGAKSEGGRVSKQQKREVVNQTICVLWLAFRDLSDEGVDFITDADLDLWTQVTAHPAIQDRLKAAAKEGE